MIIIGIILSFVALAYLCWLLFRCYVLKHITALGLNRFAVVRRGGH